MRRRTLLDAAALLGPAAPLGAATPARARGAWPSRPVSLVVPFPPRGPSDFIAGVFAPKMQAAIGKPVTIEHRPGASGEAGAISVARSAPDGHTLIIGTVGVWAINPALRAQLGYDPVKDFTPITVATTTPNVLVVNPQAVEADDLIGLMLWLKRPGARATYAHDGGAARRGHGAAARAGRVLGGGQRARALRRAPAARDRALAARGECRRAGLLSGRVAEAPDQRSGGQHRFSRSAGGSSAGCGRPGDGRCP